MLIIMLLIHAVSAWSFRFKGSPLLLEVKIINFATDLLCVAILFPTQEDIPYPLPNDYLIHIVHTEIC